MNELILPRIISVGIYNSQAVIKTKAVSPNRKTTLFELEMPIGDGGTSYIDNESHPISENMLICAKPGQLRHTKFPYKCYYIHMIAHPGEIYDILTETPVFFETAKTDIYKSLFSGMINHYNTFSAACCSC